VGGDAVAPRPAGRHLRRVIGTPAGCRTSRAAHRPVRPAERHSPKAEADLRELYRRIIFSVLTANTDDHLRNHAFLRERDGWALSPAYDLNPNPNNPVRLSTAIDFDDSTASIEVALAVCSHFRLSEAAARGLVAHVERATSRWRDVARQLGLPATEIERMTAAYETGQRRIARAMAPA
jgi:serine/threonine-protein kinase HipA